MNTDFVCSNSNINAYKSISHRKSADLIKFSPETACRALPLAQFIGQPQPDKYRATVISCHILEPK